jgi:hypothetical protein
MKGVAYEVWTLGRIDNALRGGAPIVREAPRFVIVARE